MRELQNSSDFKCYSNGCVNITMEQNKAHGSGDLCKVTASKSCNKHCNYISSYKEHIGRQTPTRKPKGLEAIPSQRHSDEPEERFS